MLRRVPLPQWLRRDRPDARRTVPGDEMDFDLRRPRPTSAPGVLLLIGVLCLVASAIAMTSEPPKRRNSLPPWPLSLGVGVALLGGSVVASAEWRRWNRIQSELARAKAELDDLARDLQHASSAGQNISELLRQRGYAEYDVRRWIVRVAGLPPLPRLSARRGKEPRGEQA